VPPPKKDTRKGLLTMIMDMPPMPEIQQSVRQAMAFGP
jgi:hypothetical protein